MKSTPKIKVPSNYIRIILLLGCYILAAGCSGDLVDRSLIEATESGDLNGVKKLLKAGANANVADDAAHTPLYYAAAKGYVDIARELIGHGADIDLVGGDSPLLWACNYGHFDMVKLLIANGADVDAKRISDHSTPLRSAAIWGGKKEIIELLIAKGANVNVVHADGDTALDRAKPEIAEILRKHGAKTGEDLSAEPWNWKELQAITKELIGTYKLLSSSGNADQPGPQVVLAANGVIRYQTVEGKSADERWKLKYLGEVHVTDVAGETDIYTVINSRKSLLRVARIVNNHRTGLIRQDWQKLEP